MMVREYFPCSNFCLAYSNEPGAPLVVQPCATSINTRFMFMPFPSLVAQGRVPTCDAYPTTRVALSCGSAAADSESSL
jgi:hypothetical protein